MPNHLANESSPYLLQHKNNPVDWYPWGEEAISRAREEGKPIFLSIGYSACHWCHVMEHESFENPEIAAYLNEHFISIKVDREERPDIDQLYMNAVQMLTGRGGWPMSVFLTPDLKPFYGGTYWPPSSSRGMPGFDQVLAAVNDAWQNRREQTLAHADELTGHIQSLGFPDRGEQRLSADMIAAAGKALERDYDAQHGGFGGAPKFPHSMDLQVLLRLWRRDGRQAWLDMVTGTLDKMAAGGIYDHLGGGFARYSVDARWLVPHFEKMLYDNALLATAYTEAFVATNDPKYARVVRETLDYVLRDMTDPAGGFYSTEDADSPVEEGGHGEEGAFYVWTPEEVRGVLGEEAGELFCRVYDVSPEGNFEGKSILNVRKSIAQQAKLLERDEAELRAELADARAKLLAARDQRIRPGRDDKVLVSWNGLMIDAMARAGAALDEPRYVEAARNAADFVLRDMSPSLGRLLHSWRGGTAKIDGYLDDYTAMANGLVSLYEATFDERYVDSAVELMDIVLDKFADKEDGAFFYTADDQEELIARTKEVTDGATPSGTSLAATALLRLGKLTGNGEYLTAAHETLKVAAPLMQRVPLAMGQMLIALDLEVGPTHELVFAGGKEARRLADGVHRRFLPRRVLAYRSGDEAEGERSKLLDAALGGKAAAEGQPTLYVCQDQVCQQPAVGADDVKAALDAL